MSRFIEYQSYNLLQARAKIKSVQFHILLQTLKMQSLLLFAIFVAPSVLSQESESTTSGFLIENYDYNSEECIGQITYSTQKRNQLEIKHRDSEFWIPENYYSFLRVTRVTVSGNCCWTLCTRNYQCQTFYPGYDLQLYFPFIYFFSGRKHECYYMW